MPKIAKELKPAAVAALKHDGGKGHTFHAVGGDKAKGLLLQVTAGGGRSWIMRIRIKGVRKHFGLGSCSEVGLTEARARAADIREAIANEADPVEAWKTASIARYWLSKGKKPTAAWAQAEKEFKKETDAAIEPVKKFTFSDAVDYYMQTERIKKLSNDKHRKQWRSTLETYAVPIIGNKAVGEITKSDITDILTPIWNDIRETANRLRGRIEAVLNSEQASEFRSGDNPASFKILKSWMDEQGTALKENQPALQLEDASQWWKALKKRDGISARALEFLTMCASRSGEVRGAVWSEFDLDAALWIIPGARMKMDNQHRVPLPPEAVALLKALPRMDNNKLVFPAARGGMLSDMTLSAVMKRMQEAEKKSGRKGWVDANSGRPAVPHGLRSTFRDWAAEKTDYPHHMSEIALAHNVGSDVERAYRRGDMIDKRRGMMTDWVKFLEGTA